MGQATEKIWLLMTNIPETLVVRPNVVIAEERDNIPLWVVQNVTEKDL
jgi:hypothetical protein